MTVDHPSVTGRSGPPLADASHWQPLYIDSRISQNGLVGESLQEYIDSHWSTVETFAMVKTESPGLFSWSGIDPGAPPPFGSAAYRDNARKLIRYSNQLDPNQGAGT